MRWLKAWHVWLMLIAATLISWAVTENMPSARLGSTAVILIAAFKINMVIAHFMELKWQPRPFRLVLSGWIALVSLIIIGGMWAA
ncbi:MAG: Prokaryotic Cytochrome oxidase subunit [Pseudomonadota bacterium]|jgi:Prokaryotic Cytochrome C oxidase subunit IV